MIAATSLSKVCIFNDDADDGVHASHETAFKIRKRTGPSRWDLGGEFGFSSVDCFPGSTFRFMPAPSSLQFSLQLCCRVSCHCGSRHSVEERDEEFTQPPLEGSSSPGMGGNTMNEHEMKAL